MSSQIPSSWETLVEILDGFMLRENTSAKIEKVHGVMGH